MPWWEAVAPKSRVPVEVERLSFDFENPRFTPEKKPIAATDSAVIAHLASSADLAELIQSISASGYVDIEPLIAIGRGDALVVLEGNRRLAALKVLRSPALADSAKVNVPELTPAKRATLDSVSVYRVLSEEDARDLIGFKHINGAKAWDAYAKALYAAHWLDTEASKRTAGEDGLTLADIAHRMGDKHDTIYRIVSAVYVLEQAQELNLFRVEDRVGKNFHFSHLYTALTHPEYREFIGMPSPNRALDPAKRPIPTSKAGELRQLLLWLFGSRSERIEPAIKSQNPDLARLKRVIGDPRSRRVMLERANLDEAVESTTTSIEKFEKSIVDGEQNLKNAQANLDGYTGDDETLMQIARSISDKSRLILRTMEVVRSDYLTEGGKVGD